MTDIFIIFILLALYALIAILPDRFGRIIEGSERG
ncbi:hypothetical protein PAECIP111893_04825 [Paenibacillus plantiphilus]|uniref:Uncharacterized protein n=1 Tax=Paenibacillus plantiphilus TaxID=2905650 RepID=A0ABN8GZ09_9BACL|nr:hypothetical protein PAECIP111893_04825 [Paenibacillus plantiphilus]